MDRADIGPANGFGVGAEMIIAEGLQAREHGVDLGFGGDEGRQIDQGDEFQRTLFTFTSPNAFLRLGTNVAQCR